MKISKKLVTAVVLGMAVMGTTTSCDKKEDIKPKKNNDSDVMNNGGEHDPNYCPACGMG